MHVEKFNLPSAVPSKFLLGLTPSEWNKIFIVIGLPLSIISVFLPSTSFWMILGLFFSAFVLLHIILTNARYIVFPGFASFIACVQLIISPSLAYHFPPVSPEMQFGAMVIDQEAYFAFATPAVMALWLGLHMPLKITSPIGYSRPTISSLSHREQKFMDTLVVLGVILSLVPLGLGMFAYILSQIRFVGSLYWLLTKTNGWQWRIGFVLFILFLQVLSTGVFYELILWGIYIILTISYVQGWKWKIVPYVSILTFVLIILNTAKPTFRNLTSAYQYSSLEKVNLLSTLMAESAVQSFINPPNFEQNHELGDSLVRYNQGWIVSRVMSHVPSQQPYGYGETIISALNDAILPRFLQPDNPGAHANSINQFTKYTGYRISGVSMGLGILGEAFANFGRLGGIAMTFIYGLGVGYIFSKLTWLALNKNIIWLAWIPFILLNTLQAEWGLSLILNSVTKSLLVAVPMIYLVPFLRKRMFTKERDPLI